MVPVTSNSTLLQFVLLFFNSEKLNISANYKSIILILLVNLPLLTYKFCQKKLQPGEPRERHLGEVRQGTLKLKFNISNHRNF